MNSVSNERAAYRVLDPNGFFGPDDTLYTVDEYGDPAVVYFDGVPNEQLEPLNDLARKRLNNLVEELDAKAKLAAEKLGRPFVARPRNIDGAIELATALAKDSMAIMGVKREVTQIERVEKVIPETGKRGRGRPVGTGKKPGPMTLQSHAA